MKNLKSMIILMGLLLSFSFFSCTSYTDYSNIPFEEAKSPAWQVL
ncbi:hypothetical protein SAMN05444274_101613 [Mariniphaga anaerophila]|uniref:Uncharacterized protein n=1 Tax=Mariniphaga anaerophila TaxID=1484053 RepID=A0A1M4U9E4_9BACT|nr:hypothetical protein SAMN05444274_101613 [Mariniphaga anaerophila]